MNLAFWKRLRTDPRQLVYWVLILAVLAAVAIFLVHSRGTHREATRVEATITAGRVQSATATAEARSQAATATIEARSSQTAN